jgi:hypothetical protein
MIAPATICALKLEAVKRTIDGGVDAADTSSSGATR